MPDGILIVDKPAGWTSMDVCAKIRGILREKRVGHAGTLDPMATGVLPVFVGRATKAVSFAESGEKEYLAALRLGVVTDTQDITGEVLETHDASAVTGWVSSVVPVTSWVSVTCPSRRPATYSFCPFSANSTPRVACPTKTGSTPVAMGSRVPPWPTRFS